METIVELEYYDAAYGPTITINVLSSHDLEKFRNLLQQLSNSEIKEVDLVNEKWIRAAGFNRMILRIARERKNEEKLSLNSKGARGIVIDWALSPPSWWHVTGLVDGLLDSRCPGHQYLTREGIDDAIVELAFME